MPRRFGLILAGFAVLIAAAPAQAATTYLINPFAGATSPQGVATDPSGDVYVADTGTGEILKVTPARIASVLASGLNAPSGVAVDPGSGTVYIADTGDHEVDRLNGDGSLTVIAGTGTAGTPMPGPATTSPLGGPAGLAVDAAGNLYIADGAGASGNPYAEKVAPDGTLSILAGNGSTGQPTRGTATSSPLRTPTGVALDATGNIFIADAAANVIEKVTPSGTLSVFAGRANGAAGQPSVGTATWSHLNHPTGVATDSGGTLYIADTDNNRVETVSPADKLALFAGTGVAGAPSYGSPALWSALHGPTAAAVDGSGVAYVADTANASVDRIAPAPPTGTAPPAPSGTTTQGHTLTAASGTWSNAPTAFAYQWERCDAAGASCADLTGADQSTYTLTSLDAGHTVRVLVTAANAGGSTTLASLPTGAIIPQPPANASPPTIAGTAVNVQTLAAAPGSWTNNPTRFTYQWQDCDASGTSCTAIAGATASTYTLALSDVGDTIRVIVTATNAGGSGKATSGQTAVIAPALVPWANTTPPSPLSAPTVSGPTTVGATLTCLTGSWSASPSGYEIQWNRGNAPIANATAATYTVTGVDRGHTLSCTVTAINSGGAIQTESARVSIPAPQKATAHRKPRRAHRRRALKRKRRRSGPPKTSRRAR